MTACMVSSSASSAASSSKSDAPSRPSLMPVMPSTTFPARIARGSGLTLARAHSRWWGLPVRGRLLPVVLLGGRSQRYLRSASRRTRRSAMSAKIGLVSIMALNAALQKYRNYKRPFRTALRAGGGRASAGLGADRAFASGMSASRGRAASPPVATLADSRQRAEHGLAASCGLALFRLRRRGRRGVTRPRQAVRAVKAGSALAPARRALRSGRGMDDPLRVWRGWRWVLRCWPRSVACRRRGRRCSAGPPEEARSTGRLARTTPDQEVGVHDCA